MEKMPLPQEGSKKGEEKMTRRGFLSGLGKYVAGAAAIAGASAIAGPIYKPTQEKKLPDFGKVDLDIKEKKPTPPQAEVKEEK